ncbi:MULTISPECIES: RES family NAD+ phosphorylase [Mesorhizobium]|uniref:RES domain-containing protein n=1 Tax=Mesorhizobium denitrificans TaxID=2294114 RepID=A0A371X9N4_9HYPH|nr:MULTISPECIES: RES domain-containing protein [Mesorhizobium]RFC65902.1 RES domain-containing protein [Mesorhizobium denitrificans]
MRFDGKLYRALNPIYAHEPLSGRGAEIYGGRFNSKGQPALYLSLSIMTALREANQAGSLQPTTLVSYDASIEGVFDSQDPSALAEWKMDPAALADRSWRDQMRSQGEASTQVFARDLFAAGYNGLLVRSFAAGAGADDLNLVLWRWGAKPPALLSLIDDEGRL